MSQVDACNDVPKGIEMILEGYDLLSNEIRQAEVLAKFMVCSEAFAEMDEDFLDYFSALSNILTTLRDHNEGLSVGIRTLLGYQT